MLFACKQHAFICRIIINPPGKRQTLGIGRIPMEEGRYLAGKSFKTAGLPNIKPGGVKSLTHDSPMVGPGEDYCVS